MRSPSAHKSTRTGVAGPRRQPDKETPMISLRTAPYAALVLRLALGAMFVAHGLVKLLVLTPAGTAQFFASVGFPGWTAYPVMAAEIFGGVMLVLGVYARWVAAVMTIELLAASSVHFANGWQFAAQGGGWEYPVFLAATSFALALLGDGAAAAKS
jgi:putative oxidoreductase